ncbi:RNA 3'-terminal phosphate cyclase [Halegenticoccus tardaugens]|uniref:RNA 3'-terminal phosphate cyclase n=1 Tax=Halegenticoccus tardaugens TaxID=2071624 RepID=UPI002B26ABB0|nr:RNA 3'-terminal phosphate cyclase [Halegenticoccus tardaugens]
MPAAVDGSTGMIELDGSAGGGQQVRTALGLSAATGEPFRMTGVRAARPNPGLAPQHLASVEAAARVCDAEVEGDELGADEVTFRPGEVRGGDVDVAIGTAGSVALLFDALLPVAGELTAPLRVRATGGTDVKWSPPVEYVRRVKLPLLSRFGLDAGVDLDRVGFYPVGGGRATLRLEPSTLGRVDLTERGDLSRVVIYSKSSKSLEGADVATRQAERARERLGERGVPVEIGETRYVETRSPGSSLLLVGVYGNSLAGFDALGERGVPSETVADRAVKRFLTFDAGPGAVDVHLADQLLAFLALGGGAVRIPEVTDHVRTNREVVEAFGYDLDLDRRDDGSVLLVA